MGKTITGETRTLLLKVLTFFESEKANKQPTISVQQAVNRACAATGVSKRTFIRIKNESKKVTVASTSSSGTKQELKLPTPGKKRKQSAKKIGQDGLDLCSLRNLVISFYTIKKEIPTINKILEVAKRDLNFPGQRTALRVILTKQLGYKFKTCKNKRTFLVQKPEIAAWRARYLRRKLENSDLGADKKPVTYLDDTVIQSNYTMRKCWQNSNDASIKKNTNPGQSWILVSAGGEYGFIPGVELLYKCKTGDHRQEINTAIFTEWLTEMLIPNLPPNGIVVLYNAHYHSTVKENTPVSSSLICEMQNWLRRRNIPFSENMSKRELYPIILKNKPTKKYIIDEVLWEHGHEVLRLPPYHCELNPIEYLWDLLKQRVAENNINQPEQQFEKIIRDAIASITTDDWKNEVDHVDRLEQEYWQTDGIEDMVRRELINSFGGEISGSESEADNEEDSDSDMSGIE